MKVDNLHKTDTLVETTSRHLQVVCAVPGGCGLTPGDVINGFMIVIPPKAGIQHHYNWTPAFVT